MADLTDLVAGNEGQGTVAGEATDGGSVSLPDGFSLSNANFETDGSDLIVTAAGEKEEKPEGEGKKEEVVESDLEGRNAQAEAAAKAAEAAAQAAAAADAAARVASEVAARAATLAARFAAQSAARGQANGATIAANNLAEYAQELAVATQAFSKQADCEKFTIREFEQFAFLGPDLEDLSAIKAVIANVNDAFREAKASEAAAQVAANAALEAAEAAAGAVGPVYFAAHEAALAALDKASAAAMAAEAAAEMAQDIIVELQGLVQAAKLEIVKADWLGTDGDDVMDVDDLNTTGQIIDGGTGDDHLIGGVGNDILAGDEGSDTLNGGDDIDMASCFDALSSVMVDLTQGIGIGDVAQGDTLLNIENFTSSAFDDTLIGDADNNVLTGGEGTETAVFEGAIGTYTINRAADGTITVIVPSVDGLTTDTDTLSGIEILSFGDKTFNVLDTRVNVGKAFDLDGDLAGDQLVGSDDADEDSAFLLDIKAELTDITEILSVTISGVPEGATLSAGTELPVGSGIWILTAAQLGGLTLTPPDNSNEDFQLTVTAKFTTARGESESITGTLDINIFGVADAPTLDVSVSSGIPGGILSKPVTSDPTPDNSSSHQVIDTDGDDYIDGESKEEFIDVGHTRNDGDHSHDDSSSSDTVLFTGSRDQYIITENLDGSFTVLYLFAGRDGTDTLISVKNFRFSDGTVAEDTLIATNPMTFMLDIDAALTDTDGSESLSISVSGLPAGAYLTFGTDNGDGTWTLTPTEAVEGSLGIVVPYDVQADFLLSVAATTTENDGSTNTVTQVVLLGANLFHRS